VLVLEGHVGSRRQHADPMNLFGALVGFRQISEGSDTRPHLQAALEDARVVVEHLELAADAAHGIARC